MYTNTKRRFNAVGINIYGGGFTLGIIKHFKVLGHWEECSLGKWTFEKNFDLPRIDTRAAWPIKEHAGKVNLVYANPPCAPWSSADVRAGQTNDDRLNDDRLSYSNHTFEAALALRPDIFILESVEAAVTKGVTYYETFKQQWLDAGYAVTYFLNDAILCGSPHTRKRFHFIAHKYQLQGLDNPPKLERGVTVADVIGDLRDLSVPLQGHDERTMKFWDLKAIEKTKPGEMVRNATHRVPRYKGKKFGFLIRRAIWDRAAYTIVGFDQIHPLDDRWLTFRECMRLYTYPDDFVARNYQEAQKAVLPVVGDFLGKVASMTLAAKQPAPVEHMTIDWRPYAAHLQILSKKRPIWRQKMTDIMVDLETVGVVPGCAIFAIGAVAFSEEGLGQEFYTVVNLPSCESEGLYPEAKTLAWWDQQNDDARAVLEEARTGGALLADAMAEFSLYLSGFGIDDVKVWGNGADFDNAILACCYEAVCDEPPWKPWNNRCYRTLKNLVKGPKLQRIGTYHNALDDAKSQALHAIELMKCLKAQ